MPSAALPLRAEVALPGGGDQAYWYDVPEACRQRIAVGALVLVPLQSRFLVGLVIELGHPELAFRTREIEDVLVGGERLPVEWPPFLKWLGHYYGATLSQVLQACLPAPLRKQLAASRKEPAGSGASAKKSPKADGNRAPDKGPGHEASHEKETPLNQEQKTAVDAVSEALDAGRFQSFLLHGITGSGKTLVYLHLARVALRMGRSVLILLPEIGLTPQTLFRFREFLDAEVYAMHSNLGAAERRALWTALLSARPCVIVGARSALLAPISGLGLIVVDEEHDGSYKQSEALPRYHARDAALYRGRLCHCPVVLGSATPSLESFASAQAGKMSLLTLTKRATGAPKPKVMVVDMRREHHLQGASPLSAPLREALIKTLDAGSQAILFLNRRGYSHRRICLDCGSPLECPRCLVPLTYHKTGDRMLCHYCDFALRLPLHCPGCGSGEFLDSGAGIEKVEELLNQLFPEAGVLRMDRDSTSRIGSAERLLAAFRARKAGILLGTQMVAKGHDFPGVKLVGVLDADSGLGLPDFRAQERAFQLITQVAGRAGRHGEEGLVYLQTFRPQNPCLRFALDHDFLSFFEAEMELRRELGYPPWSRLLLVEISGEGEDWVLQHMQEFGKIFRQYAEAIGAEVLGPGFAAMKRIDNRYRSQIFAKGKAANQLQWLLRKSLDACQPAKPTRTRLRADMDPLSIL